MATPSGSAAPDPGEAPAGAPARDTGAGDVAVGQLRESHKLRTRATYRVAALEGDLVVVEVVDAPGLEAGEVLRFTRAAVAAMAVVGAPGG